MTLVRCSGTTKAGLQCKIMVKDGTYCYHHQNQSTTSPKTDRSGAFFKKKPQQELNLQKSRSSSPAKPFVPKKTSSLPRVQYFSSSKASKAGFIYIYTMAAFYNKSGNDWLQTRNLIGSKKDKWTTVNPIKHNIMLIKVGMTTQTVEKRLQQWESKCLHKLVCIHPGIPLPQSSSILELFQRLSISKELHKAYSAFSKEDKGFVVKKDVAHAEREIHEELRRRFGRGDVYCQGCMEDKQKHEKSTTLFPFKSKKDDFIERKEYNVHREWFPIPSKNMDDVYQIIDKVCSRSNT